MTYILHILVLISIYIIVALSLNIVTGYAGRVSLAHAAIYGAGAYAAALLALQSDGGVLLPMLVASLVGALCGCCVAACAVRLAGDLFVIATFAFQVLLSNVMNNWISVTKGPLGLVGIPTPSVFGVALSSHLSILSLTSCCAVLACVVSVRLSGAPFGNVLRAIREDETWTQLLGKNVTLFKFAGFAISGALVGMAGSLYAYYMGFIDPSSFSIGESVFMISVLTVGGAGTVIGPIVGAVLLVCVPELLRLCPVSGAVAAEIRQVLYGGLLVVFMMWRPKGLLGEVGLGGD